MEIRPNEVESIEDIGELNGHPVRMARLHGGLCVAIGRNSGADEALAAGSHPAIVRYNVEKNFRGFQPSMMKSEADQFEIREHTHALGAGSPYGLYSLKKNNEIDFVLTKSGVEKLRYTATIEPDCIRVNAPLDVDSKPELAAAASRAVAHLAAARAVEEGKTNIAVRGKTFKAASVL